MHKKPTADDLHQAGCKLLFQIPLEPHFHLHTESELWIMGPERL